MLGSTVGAAAVSSPGRQGLKGTVSSRRHPSLWSQEWQLQGQDSGSGCPSELSQGGSCSAICDAEQLPHEGASEGVYVLDAQQPLGVLGVDAAKLGEHGHDLQEQEAAGRQRTSWGCGPPSPHPPTLGLC